METEGGRAMKQLSRKTRLLLPAALVLALALLAAGLALRSRGQQRIAWTPLDAADYDTCRILLNQQPERLITGPQALQALCRLLNRAEAVDGSARQELLRDSGLQQTGSLRFYSGGTLRAYFPLYEGEGRLYLAGWDEQGYQIRWPLPEDSGGALEQLLAQAELPGGIPCPAAEELQAALVQLWPEDAALQLDAEDLPALCEALRQCRETASYAQQLPDALRYEPCPPRAHRAAERAGQPHTGLLSARRRQLPAGGRAGGGLCASLLAAAPGRRPARRARLLGGRTDILIRKLFSKADKLRNFPRFSAFSLFFIAKHAIF